MTWCHIEICGWRLPQGFSPLHQLKLYKTKSSPWNVRHSTILRTNRLSEAVGADDAGKIKMNIKTWMQE